MLKEVGSRRRVGFTLIELLVVIAIIGILVGLLLPAVQQVREAARRTSCINNLKQLAVAVMNREGSMKRFPSGLTQVRLNAAGQQYISGSTAGFRFQGHSVYYFILPFMEQNNLYDGMDLRIPINNVVTDPALGRAAGVVPSFLCPSDLLPSTALPYTPSSGPTEYYGPTSYKANGGSRPVFATSSTNDGVFMATGPNARKAATAPLGIEVSIRDITDGTSNTIMFGEGYHRDLKFDTFTAAGWTGGSTIEGWSRWYPAGGDPGLSNIMGGAFAPINYKIPWNHGEPGAPTTQAAWFTFQDMRLSAFGSGHPAGANFVRCDGSASFISDQISQTVLQAFCTRSNNEIFVWDN